MGFVSRAIFRPTVFKTANPKRTQKPAKTHMILKLEICRL